MSEQTARQRARAARQAQAAEDEALQRPRNGQITQAQLEVVLQPGDPPWYTEADRPKKAPK